MEKEKILKLIGYGVLAILILNLVMFALKIITGIIFWVVIILAALFVYKLLPKIKKK